jgi:hypothetical protein
MLTSMIRGSVRLNRTIAIQVTGGVVGVVEQIQSLTCSKREKRAFGICRLSAVLNHSTSLQSCDDMHSVRIQSLTRGIKTHWNIASTPRRHVQRALGTFAVCCASDFQECARC